MKKLLIQSVVALSAGWLFLYGSSVSAVSIGGSCGEQDRILSAIGYGTAHQEWLSEGQLQIMAIRAAKMDAFRSLAEQVQGVQINGQSTISTLVSKSDMLRVRVDALVRGASMISVNPIQENTFEVMVELKMTPAMLARAGLCKMPEPKLEPEQTTEVIGEQPLEQSPEEMESDQEQPAELKLVVPQEIVEMDGPEVATEEDPIVEQQTVPDVDETVEVTKSRESADEAVKDGLDMDLVEAVRKNQSQAPILLRDAIVGGMDREVALASVLTGMVEPEQMELENVINQAVALGLNRDEADRAVNRVKQACSVCDELESPAEAPIMEIESGPIEASDSVPLSETAPEKLQPVADEESVAKE